MREEDTGIFLNHNAQTIRTLPIYDTSPPGTKDGERILELTLSSQKEAGLYMFMHGCAGRGLADEREASREERKYTYTVHENEPAQAAFFSILKAAADRTLKFKREETAELPWRADGPDQFVITPTKLQLEPLEKMVALGEAVAITPEKFAVSRGSPLFDRVADVQQDRKETLIEQLPERFDWTAKTNARGKNAGKDRFTARAQDRLDKGMLREAEAFGLVAIAGENVTVLNPELLQQVQAKLSRGL